MEREKKINYTIRLFTHIMRQMVSPSFSFPGGGLATKAVAGCIEALEKKYSCELSEERVVDFCICQIYAISGFDPNYMRRWNASHSFGKKALDRYAQSNSRKKYYEDRWLKRAGYSRPGFLYFFRDRKEHPLYKFIYPEYEEPTKRRIHNAEVGFYICQLATLLWSPFSPACGECKNADRCTESLKKKYPELYRIRVEEFSKQNNQ